MVFLAPLVTDDKPRSDGSLADTTATGGSSDEDAGIADTDVADLVETADDDDKKRLMALEASVQKMLVDMDRAKDNALAGTKDPFEPAVLEKTKSRVHFVVPPARDAVMVDDEEAVMDDEEAALSIKHLHKNDGRTSNTEHTDNDSDTEDEYAVETFRDPKVAPYPFSEVPTGNTSERSGANEYHNKILEHLDSLRAELVEQANTPMINLSCIQGRRRRSSMMAPSEDFHTGTTTRSDVEHMKQYFPRDVYILMALNGPLDFRWTTERFFIFMFGLMVTLIQISMFFLLILGEINAVVGTAGDNDNPGDGTFADFIPANASPIVRGTQLVSLLAYVMFPESTLQDLVKAFQLFPRSFDERDYPSLSMGFSCLIRCSQCLFGMIVVWIMVMSSETVIEIILNFAAINFISELDELAFSLAEAGVFGRNLQEGSTNKVLNTKLPRRYHLRPYHYWIVMGFAFIVLFTFSGTVMWLQDNDVWWRTQEFRVQFRDENLQSYSGCFEMSGAKRNQRHIYNSMEKENSASFGYCRNKRQWILFKEPEDNSDPCETPEVILARSPSTDTYDISTSFEESTLWATAGNAPLDWYVMGYGSEQDLNCELALGNGICDAAFNSAKHNFDNGDCCASTCNHPNCGRYNVGTIFDSSIVPEVSFPECKDVDTMRPIIIELNNFTSSRDPKFDHLFDSDISWNQAGQPWEMLIQYDNELEWRNEKPELSYFSLYCNDKNILTAYINETTMGGIETVMVEDGSCCRMDVRSDEINMNDLFWVIDYSIYHEKKDDQGKHIAITGERSSQDQNTTFTLIPKCYCEQLTGHVNTTSIYTGSEPSNKALNWLLEEDNHKDGSSSNCKSEFFTERFALATLLFSMEGEDKLIENYNQCTWPTITCSGGAVEEIDMRSAGLTGAIPSEIRMLSSLTKIRFAQNNLTEFPLQVLRMENLTHLDLQGAQIKGTIPSMIGLLNKLDHLHLDNNEFYGSIPSEIGMLNKMCGISITGTNISGSIPSEIGLLTKTTCLRLDGNELQGSIPTEIGLLNMSLFNIGLSYNELTGTVPSEIGSLTGLHIMGLGHTQLTGSIPSEIVEVKQLEKLDLCHNQLSDNIPSAIGLLTELEYVDLSHNQLAGAIPSEVGLLTKLREISLSSNELTGSVPSEVGLLANLTKLSFDNNELEGRIPSEVGMLSHLHNLELSINRLTGDIPTEVEFLAKTHPLCGSINVDSNMLVGSVPSELDWLIITATCGNGTTTDLP